MTKQNGVDVWPNAAIWMRDELRSKVTRHEETINFMGISQGVGRQSLIFSSALFHAQTSC